MRSLLVWGIVGASLLTGCVRHIQPYEKKVRMYEPEQYAAPEEARSVGSLWGEGSAGLFEDARARRIGDILTIRIDEQADGTRASNTKASRQSSLNIGVSSFFDAMTSLVSRFPGMSAAELISASTKTEFDGGGSTQRSGALLATLPVRIKKSMPNGDYYVEGRKVLLLNDEETHLYVSGVVRPVDISPDNSVASSYLADVELEYTGRGVLSEKQNVGWLSRALDYVWPF
jgi:flagellar L-ring protein FlgH